MDKLFSGTGGLAPIAVETITVKGVSYVKEATLGEGSYGIVVRARAPDGRQVAVKRCMLSTRAAAEQFRRECELMEAAGPHRNIVPCIAWDIYKEPASGKIRGELVLGLCATTLVATMQELQRSARRFSAQQLARILGGVGHAICHLQLAKPSPIAHRDVKAENVLMTSSGVAQLTDFGSATCEALDYLTGQQIGIVSGDIERTTTMAYRAPELADLWQRQRCDERVDNWAFGVLAYYLCFFQLPFEETKLAIVNSTLTFPSGATMPPDVFVRVIRGCLEKDAGKRMSIFHAVTLLHEAYPSEVPALEASQETIRARTAQPNAFGNSSATAAASTSSTPPPAITVERDNGPKAGGALFGMLAWNTSGDSGVPPSFSTSSAPPPPPATTSQRGAPLSSDGSNLFSPTPPIAAALAPVPHARQTSAASSSLFSPSASASAQARSADPAAAPPRAAVTPAPGVSSAGAGASSGLDLFGAWGGPTSPAPGASVSGASANAASAGGGPTTHARGPSFDLFTQANLTPPAASAHVRQVSMEDIFGPQP